MLLYGLEIAMSTSIPLSQQLGLLSYTLLCGSLGGHCCDDGSATSQDRRRVGWSQIGQEVDILLLSLPVVLLCANVHTGGLWNCALTWKRTISHFWHPYSCCYHARRWGNQPGLPCSWVGPSDTLSPLPLLPIPSHFLLLPPATMEV